MKTMIRTLVLTLAGGIALGVLGDRAPSAQQAPVTRTILQQKDIEGLEGREAVVYVAEFAPGAVAGRHFHPGPEVGYVLHGALIVEPDGHPPMTLKTGETFHNPTRHVHAAKNPSTTESVKVLVFLVGVKGQPLAIPVQ